jgi:hypothetical protein
MIPDRSSDFKGTEPVSDEIWLQNVVRVERDPAADGWYAVIGPDGYRGLGRYGPSPGRALLALASEIREKGWVLDPTWTRTADLPKSPNVIALRRLGPRDWCAWYAQGLGPVDVTATDRDACIALCGFALRLKERCYLFDAEFRTSDIPEPEAFRSG